MSQRAAGPAGLSLDDLRILAKLEGKPLPRGQALAAALGASPSVAWRRVRNLRRLGALSLVSPVGLRPGMCECVTYLKVDWVHGNSLDPLDSWIANDPAILTAARVTGRYDYRLSSRHQDIGSADDWSRGLLSRPKVAEVLTQFCSTVFNRPTFAAAILGTD
jgi:DNA-binding Lrp family transcriptional regulator